VKDYVQKKNQIYKETEYCLQILGLWGSCLDLTELFSVSISLSFVKILHIFCDSQSQLSALKE